MLKRLLPLALCLWLLLSMTSLAVAQDPSAPPDADGDTVPDAYDSCAAEAGLLENSGCPAGVTPDFDADGIADYLDYCYNVAGVEEYRGCPADGFPDYDSDGVPDFDDACYADAGIKDNSGCPEGVVPDFDGDGLPDPQDTCPREYGPVDNNGCIADADGDTVPDDYDICPDLPGLTERVGCPADFQLPDTDGDTLEDPFDGCPNEAGPQTTGGCPDADGDTVPDTYDLCPAEAGDPIISGCTLIETTTLPTNRAPLTTANVGSLTELASLRLSAWQMMVTLANQLFLQSGETIRLYDLNNPQLAPNTLTLSQTAQTVINRQGTVIASSTYDQLTGLPAITIWDPATQTQVSTINLEGTSYGNMTFSPDGTVLVTTHVGDYLPVEQADSSIKFWDVATGQLLNSVPYELGIVAAMYSPDGTKVIGQTTQSQIVIWDAATGAQLGVIEGNWSPFIANTPVNFSPDGSLIATISVENQVSLWSTADFSLVTTLPLENTANQNLTALAFSPDGTLLAIADGVIFFEGPILPDVPASHIRIVDIATGQVVNTFEAHTSVVSFISFTPDGTMLVTNGDVTVKFWGVLQ